ncbi:methyl-accepting chemotaxis protein [Metabacillus litoralis]|uniref:methyl-accepting chemotaxis protein n=1 Tax=Metabacillus litoralis TaxID=152268 RepID=UPI001CFCB8D5|nr:methyl-accepting chemotaxis protein [Metabacillus litoralis]
MLVKQVRCFAVVPNEVRKLADQSSQATEEMTHSIKMMESISDQASTEFNAMLTNTQTHLSVAKESRGSFDLLMNEITNVNNKLSGINTYLQELSKSIPGNFSKC